MKKITFEQVVCFIIISLMILIPSFKLVSYSLYLLKIIESVNRVSFITILWWSTPVLLFTYIYQIVINKEKIDYKDILIHILIILGIISTIYAVSRKISIYGEVQRNEGFLTLLFYYLSFLNVKNLKTEKSKKIIITTFMIIAIIENIYALLQVFTSVGFVKHYSKSYMAMGLCGNPNFYGEFVIMPLLFSIVMYLTKKEYKYLFLSIFFMIGLCLASSSGPFIGFVLSIIFMLIVFHKQFKLKNCIIILISIILTFILTDQAVKLKYNNKTKIDDNGMRITTKIDENYNIIKELENTVKIIKESKSEQELLDNNVGNGRIQLWKNSLPLVKKYWLTGSGIDTFAKVYPQVRPLVFDKAHNVYLQIAITNGIPALITYCSLCFILFLKGLKFKDKTQIALFMAFVGYCIQAFANISVIEVAPYFFILFGLLYSYNNEKINNK